MAVDKQGYNIPFGQGLDTKSDANQVAAGKMLVLQNAVFNKGQLQKRNGFANLTTLPNSEQTTLTTLNDNLLATGTNLYAYSADTDVWLNQGLVQPVDLSVTPIVRTSTSQTAVDSVTAPNGLVIVAYTDSGVAYYRITDSVTNQAVVNQLALPSTATNPRTFILGRYFIITFMRTSGGAPAIQYIAIPYSTPSTPGSTTTISTQVSSITKGYDAYSIGSTLFIAWDANDGGGAVRVNKVNSSLVLGAVHAIPGHTADLVSVTVDETQSTPVVWISFWDATSTNGFATALNQNLIQVLAPTQIITAKTINELTSLTTNMLLTVLYENINTYSYSAVRSDFISKVTITQAGAVGSTTTILRSVGLASKPFLNSFGIGCVLVVYGGAFQPTYFLIDWNGNILLKLAYSNGVQYLASQVLPSITIVDDHMQVAYLIKDLLVAVNKTQGAANVNGVYTQTGINLATISINSAQQNSSEIAQNLHLTGGFLWQYDTVKPVEHGFHVWPEDLLATTSATGGLITAQQYYYIFTYEWTDAQGLLHRSAPSIPMGVLTTGTTSTNTINVPTYRLTYKIGTNPVRLVGYRWSTAQQTYYQFTSITSPVINDTTIDSIAVTDTQADSAILGNTILYTTGGVIENIGAPANTVTTLFKSRLFLVDAEDRNLIWYSKVVLSGTPVELSDLQTMFIAPTSGAQGSTGPITALTAMDDKLIIFKKDAIYYVTGNGPDATGANNDFSEPVFITSTVGCSNQKSVVFMPQGVMFQSDKGIWLLGRDLSTSYIGAPVEQFNSSPINSALSIPGTNEVRFTANSGTVLMYDYYYGQWGTFVGVPAISSVLYQGMHTYLNVYAQVRKETSNAYLDGSVPVLLSFSTAWLKLTNLQGFQRAYFFYFLGTFLSPHKLNVQITYDYSPGIYQTTLITPPNNNPLYGADTIYGGGNPYGGMASLEQWRVFFDRQKCQAIQISVTEVFDPTQGVVAGAGFTMSGLNLVFGGKATYPKLPSNQSAS